MRKLLSLLGLSLAFVAMTPAAAESCTCRPSGPPCQEVWESPVVFAGTVIELDQSAGALGPRRVRFRISEAFRGAETGEAETGEIEIHLRGGGGASCDPPFRLGESWLVYASKHGARQPGWTTSTCSRTRRLSGAAEDLRYLRLADQQKPPSHIAGQVTRDVYDAAKKRTGDTVPVAGVPVVVTSGTTRLEAKTDRDGRYHIPVDAGRPYQVDFGRSADGLVIRGPSAPVVLRHSLACAVVDGYVR